MEKFSFSRQQLDDGLENPETADGSESSERWHADAHTRRHTPHHHTQQNLSLPAVSSCSVSIFRDFSSSHVASYHFYQYFELN